MKKNKLAIAILNFNLPDMTDALAKQCKKHQDLVDVFVIDNGSDKPLPKSTTHQIPENLGYTRGYNFWLRDLAARKLQYPAYIFANNDVELIDENIFEHLQYHLQARQNTGCISPAIEGPAQPFMASKGSSGLRRVPFIDGMFMCITERVLAEQPLFDERMHVGYGVDVEYGILAKRFGLYNYVVDDVRIRHLGHKTFGDDQDAFIRWAKQGSKEMEHILKEKYGKQWRYMGFEWLGDSYEQ